MAGPIRRAPSYRAALVIVAAAAGLLVAYTPAAQASPAPGHRVRSAFPVTVTAHNGRVRIGARPTRIISLSPTATEMLFKIGAGSQVVAVDEDSDYPRAAPRTKLSGLEPNIEAIARYRPDLVVLDYDPDGFAARLARAGVPVVVDQAVGTLRGEYHQIDQLGRATGHARAAGRVVAGLEATMRRLVRAAPHFGRPLTYYYELDQTHYSVTSKTFIGRVLARLDLVSIADAAKGAGSGYPQLSAEYIAKADPDLIVLADTRCCHQSAASLARRPGWSDITAVREHAVVAVNDDVASRWGPRIVDLVASVERMLWRLKSTHRS